MEETTNQKIVVTTDDSKKKKRRIVTWTPEEDDILREQINLHGTENWTIIASKFTDKSTRQCRRRWYTYLNSDFKRGDWSPEEDALLCEAQRLYGNKWTKIAKMISGRTDNAVKNRFTTLCKKRAKDEAMAKENKIAYSLNSNNKRLLSSDGISTPGKVECESPLTKKLRRSHISCLAESKSYGDRSHIKDHSGMNEQKRPPFSVLAHNATGIDGMKEQKQTAINATYRQPHHHDSPASSEYRSGSTSMPHFSGDDTIQPMSVTHKTLKKQNDGELLQAKGIVSDKTLEQVDLRPTYQDVLNVPMLGDAAYNSPDKVTPSFRSLAAAVPSPQFSESERNFLLKTLGGESPYQRPSANHLHAKELFL